MTSPSPLFEVRDLRCSLNGTDAILHNVNFAVNEGDILVLQGKSGSGKSTLLKCLAHLNMYDGDILYRGKTPKSYGIPNFRTHVLYVPQRPSILPGTPRDFLKQLFQFAACKSRIRDVSRAGSTASSESLALDISEQWGVESDVWDRPWSTLSGGESQRLSLATALGLNTAEILLLDEPTSALDADTSYEVEKYLSDMINADDSKTKSIIWITHSDEQGGRVGTRFLTISDGEITEDTTRHDA